VASFITGVLRRAPLVMMTVVFTLISFRYLHDPVHAAGAVGISFTSPGGIVIARVGFAAFPLANSCFCKLDFSISATRRALHGSYIG